MRLPVLVAQFAGANGCGYYRVVQPAEALQRAQLVDVRLGTDWQAIAESCANADTLLIQLAVRAEANSSLSRLRQQRPDLRLIQDIDDLITQVPESNRHAQALPARFADRVLETTALCDRLIVSTQPLAEAFVSYCHDIRVVANRIDEHRWQHCAPKIYAGSKPRVGWAGAAGHDGDLAMIAEVVFALADEVDWVFFGMCPDALLPYVQEFHHGVAIEQYPAKLARLGLDLALAPLEINAFNEAKSNLKLLEYGILGYPVICTDIYPYQGDLPVTRVCNRTEEWVAAIREHLADRTALRQFGLQLQAAVKRHWLLAPHLAEWQAAWVE